MSKSFQILAFYALLFVFTQSLNSFKTETIPFNQSQIQYKFNEFKDYSESIDIEDDYKHHKDKKNGYHDTYLKNHADNLNIYHNTALSEEESITELYIEYEDNTMTKYIGYQGTLSFVLNYNDSETNIFNASDIEEKTSFKTTIVVDNANTFNVDCKLWKPIEEKLNMFCKLNDNLEYGKLEFNLNPSSFDYNGTKFTIIQHKTLYLFQLNETIPFLYSSKQVLNIEENTETYYLKFKLGEYHNEPLVIRGMSFGFLVLDECTEKGKELLCKIEKDKIEEYVANNGQKLSIYYVFLYSKGNFDFEAYNIYSIYGIHINYNLIKKDIYVEITRLLEDNINLYNTIAYETNVTNITNVYSNLFELQYNLQCCLKKSEGIALTIICMNNYEREFSL